MILYRRATLDDLDVMAGIAAKSFIDYPLYQPFKKVLYNEKDFPIFVFEMERKTFKSAIKNKMAYIGIKDRRIVSMLILKAPYAKEPSKCKKYIDSYRIHQYIHPTYFQEFIDVVDACILPCKEKYPESLYVNILCANPSAKGQGYGSSMLKNCAIPFAKSRNYKELTLITHYEPNVKFYTKNNFDIITDMNMDFLDEEVTNWCFGYEL